MKVFEILKESDSLMLESSKDLGIGDYVKLKKPINGCHFAQIYGFGMDKSAKLQHVHGMGIMPVGKVAHLMVHLIDDNQKDTGGKTNVPQDQLTKVSQSEMYHDLKAMREKKIYTGSKVTDPNAIKIQRKDSSGKLIYTITTDLKKVQVDAAPGQKLDIYDVYGEQFRDSYSEKEAIAKFESIFTNCKSYDDVMDSIKTRTRLDRTGKFLKVRGTGKASVTSENTKLSNLGNFMFEAIDPALENLIKKFNLTSNRAGSLINDFNFTDAHGKAFDEAGYTIEWDGRKNKFEVKKKLTDRELRMKQGDEEFAAMDVSGRKAGFKPRRKSGL